MDQLTSKSPILDPLGLRTPLLPHQKAVVFALVDLEDKGKITQHCSLYSNLTTMPIEIRSAVIVLADPPGTGKTRELISLCLLRPVPTRMCTLEYRKLGIRKSPNTYFDAQCEQPAAFICSTLVIASPAQFASWCSELSCCLLRMLVISRSSDVKNARMYDIVLCKAQHVDIPDLESVVWSRIIYDVESPVKFLQAVSNIIVVNKQSQLWPPQDPYLNHFTIRCAADFLQEVIPPVLTYKYLACGIPHVDPSHIIFWLSKGLRVAAEHLGIQADSCSEFSARMWSSSQGAACRLADNIKDCVCEVCLDYVQEIICVKCCGTILCPTCALGACRIPQRAPFRGRCPHCSTPVDLLGLIYADVTMLDDWHREQFQHLSVESHIKRITSGDFTAGFLAGHHVEHPKSEDDANSAQRKFMICVGHHIEGAMVVERNWMPTDVLTHITDVIIDTDWIGLDNLLSKCQRIGRTDSLRIHKIITVV